MNVRLLAALLCLAAVSTGCIINNNGHDHDTDPQPGDVSFLWSFAGASTAGRCTDVPEVRKVRITIPGQTLLNGGIYPCNTSGVDGITLSNFAPGGYNYTVEALGYSDEVLYTANGAFTVNGNKQVSTTLAPVTRPPAPGDVTFLWAFSGSPLRHCADVPEVRKVRITIPGQTLLNGGIYACNTTGVDGIILRAFAPGGYGYTVDALGSSDEVLYSAGGSFTVNGDRQVNVVLAPFTPPPAPGDVTFLWTFSDGRCADVPDVKSIRISIPGETLANGGIYPCNTSGVDGIVLHDFRPGAYSFTLEAISYSGTVLYTGSGSFTVNGDIRVNYTLTPSGGPSSYAYVSWTFPPNTTSPNPTCAQAGVVSVDVSIDGGAWTRLSCMDGAGANQIRSPYLPPGSHTIAFIGVGSGGQHYYYTQSTMETRAGAPVSVSYLLRPVGGMALRWELREGSVTRTCAQAGVTTMAINLQNTATGEYVYGAAGDAQPCTGAPILYNYLEPGNYRVYIRGTGPDVFYTNEDGSPVTLTVKAFELKSSADAVTIVLMRK
ncbi:hypothetical protein ATI61_101147 [Archangium gephyra]|uniref:PEGA domain-containing protein n=1 Tax=Archangium gephyra TaxID=48 RepID=A0AAC8QBW0_9BACT|nr:hypothetical protein [Archangium gephyra]AKJ04780.1 Hypothetical protein AA314_06406 [Archangium gephyra]REG37169.1 hypothetical protein ATI61_101147 [Archangium gephyra]